MSQMKNFSFYEWSGGASEEEINSLIKKVRIRFWIFLVLGLIPYLNLIFMGLAIFCFNNLNILKTRGRSNGSDLLRVLMLLYGLFIFPIAEVWLCSKIRPLGTLVSGIKWKE